MLLKWAAAVLMTIGTTAPIGTAAQAGNARLVASPEQAGYSVTGNRFTGVETTVKLPDAGRFAGELGHLSVSVQLWTSQSVLDLKVTACTDASCKPGGKPESRRYHLEFAVYSRTTGALTCSTSAARQVAVPVRGKVMEPYEVPVGQHHGADSRGSRSPRRGVRRRGNRAGHKSRPTAGLLV